MSKRRTISTVVIVSGLLAVVAGCIFLASGRAAKMGSDDEVFEVPIRDYDMRSMTVTEPIPPPSVPQAPDHVVPDARPVRKAPRVEEREFVCGPSEPLEQGGGSVRRCEWVKKTKP